MPRGLFVAVIGVLLLVIPLSAQDRPDFSGTWTLVVDGREPPSLSADDREFIITQTADTIVLNIPVTIFSGWVGSDGRTSTDQVPGRRLEPYRLDGSTTQRVLSGPRPVDSTSVALTRMRVSAGSTAWNDDRLIITTQTRLIHTDASGQSTTSNLGDPRIRSLSLSAEGLLVLASVTAMSPQLLATRLVEPPEVMTRVYRRVVR